MSELTQANATQKLSAAHAALTRAIVEILSKDDAGQLGISKVRESIHQTEIGLGNLRRVEELMLGVPQPQTGE